MADAVRVLSRKLSVTDSLAYTYVVILPHRYRPQRPDIPYPQRLPFHRRRIKSEEKAKVVRSVWGTEFIQFLAGLAVLIISAPPPPPLSRSDDILPFLLSLSFCYGPSQVKMSQIAATQKSCSELNIYDEWPGCMVQVGRVI